MIKWLAAVVLILVLAFCSIYIFITPSGIKQSTVFSVNAAAFKRTFPDEKAWEKWWPGEVSKNAEGRPDFIFNGNSYRLVDKRINALIITIDGKNKADSTVLDFLSLHPDSIILDWKVRLQASISPFQRIREKNREGQLKKDILHLQKAIQEHFSVDSNIYGITILKEQVRDSLLVSTFATTPDYPDTEFIYALVDNLQNYIQSQGAEETGHPMVHVTTRDSLEFTSRVAIPVDRKLPGSGSISYKWMLGGGNILVTEVKGGPHAIREAFRQLEYYVVDHRRTAPAIPFESLVTDRRKQKDTAAWVTRVYYPVM